ncbi:MAG: ABC transporter ATP-binding protein [Calditrichaeota bacterium]|nr:ABC transporter ATP-binding protein [Candidatus Cloacimonadota bacterium]MCB1047506.1 ABC transporter ATP-binding protein [Calditrichota bacterium]
MKQAPPPKVNLDPRILARLVRMLLPYKGMAALALLMILGASLLETAVPLITRHAIDVDIHDADMESLSRTIALYLLVVAGAFLLRFFQQVVTGWIGQAIVVDMRRALYKRVSQMQMGWFDRNPVGQIMTRLTNDVENLNQLFTGGLILIFQDILSLILIVAALFMLDWKLALVLLAVLPPILFATFQFKKLVRQAFRRVRALVGEVNTFLQENITGLAVVRLFRREARNRELFGAINDRLMNENIRTIFYFSVFFPLMEVLGSVAVAAVIWKGGHEVLAGALTFGTLVAFLNYAERFFRPIRDLAEKYNILQSAMAAAERVFEIMDQEPSITGGSIAVRELRGEIEFRNVSFAYEPGVPVIRDLSFHIPAGSSAALVGYTGSGKSTVASLLLRFYEPQSGSILIDGVDLRELKLDELRRRMAIVLQDVFLFSGSVRENIGLGADYDDQRLREAARRVGLLDWIDRQPDGLDHEVNERGQSLSGGQRQLVSFARALAHDPAVLLLDEATSSVDTISEGLIQKAIEELLRDRTSLVIAHRLSTIQNVDHILVLHQGRLVEQGTHRRLMENQGIYHRLWTLQSSSQRHDPLVGPSIPPDEDPPLDASDKDLADDPE